MSSIPFYDFARTNNGRDSFVNSMTGRAFNNNTLNNIGNSNHLGASNIMMSDFDLEGNKHWTNYPISALNRRSAHPDDMFASNRNRSFDDLDLDMLRSGRGSCGNALNTLRGENWGNWKGSYDDLDLMGFGHRRMGRIADFREMLHDGHGMPAMFNSNHGPNTHPFLLANIANSQMRSTMGMSSHCNILQDALLSRMHRRRHLSQDLANNVANHPIARMIDSHHPRTPREISILHQHRRQCGTPTAMSNMDAIHPRNMHELNLLRATRCMNGDCTMEDMCCCCDPAVDMEILKAHRRADMMGMDSVMPGEMEMLDRMCCVDGMCCMMCGMMCGPDGMCNCDCCNNLDCGMDMANTLNRRSRGMGMRGMGTMGMGMMGMGTMGMGTMGMGIIGSGMMGMHDGMGMIRTGTNMARRISPITTMMNRTNNPIHHMNPRVGANDFDPMFDNGTIGNVNNNRMGWNGNVTNRRHMMDYIEHKLNQLDRTACGAEGLGMNLMKMARVMHNNIEDVADAMEDCFRMSGRSLQWE
ncbi:hypothetical protein HDV00_011375 [Rhizophlyctis rosea]|nr:hypothetical protein HDV00_011375 [Rhizophlyctis rosea]